MLMNEVHTIFNGVPLTYCYRPGYLDCRHLLVIFSGFGARSNFTYNFSGGSLDKIPSHILWIKDDFYGNCCYYLCYHMNFDIGKTCSEFILHFARQHYLDEKNITLCGGSKGGSAALYIGLKYNFLNIISSAPQIKIGSFINAVHKELINHIMVNSSNCSALDSVITDACEYAEHEKNIYLFSSDVDEYERCEDIHKGLCKFSNFNHIVTRSDCVRRHNMITAYNLPLILSIISAHSQKLYPKYGELIYNGTQLNKNVQEILKSQIEQKAVAELTSCIFSENKIFPEGAAFIRGIPCPDYGILRKTMICKSISSHKKYRFNVGSVKDRKYSKIYFKDVFVNYDTAGFASCKYAGINMNIPFGVYEISMEIQYNGKVFETPLHINVPEFKGIMGNAICRIYTINNKTVLKLMDSISVHKPDVYRLTNFWKKGSILHYEGFFCKYGIEVKYYSDIEYYIVLKSKDNVFIFRFGKNKCMDLANIFDDLGHYELCNFCSIGRRGIDISILPSGIYDIYNNACGK